MAANSDSIKGVAVLEMTTTKWTESARSDWHDAQITLGQQGPVYATASPDEAWRERFTNMQSDRAGVPASLSETANEDFLHLVVAAKARLDDLLVYGGWAVCHPALDDDIDRVLSRGFLLSGKGAALAPGRPSSCHENAARFWHYN